MGLARRFQSGTPVRAEALAVEQSIPAKYLVQILIELKGQNIVKSQRGKDGGYLLARPPSEITMGDILRCIHGQILDTPALNDPQTPPVLKNFWKKLSVTIQETADAVNFQSLLEAGERHNEMYYI